MQPKGRGRIAQAKQMMQKLQGFQGFVVMAGDWNCTPMDNPGGTTCGTYETIRAEMNDAWNGKVELGATWDQLDNPLAVSKTNDVAYQNVERLQWRCDIIFWQDTYNKRIKLNSSQ